MTSRPTRIDTDESGPARPSDLLHRGALLAAATRPGDIVSVDDGSLWIRDGDACGHEWSDLADPSLRTSHPMIAKHQPSPVVWWPST